MKNLFKIMLALMLVTASAFAKNGQNGVMDKLTNDSAFSGTEALFHGATADDSDAGEALLSGVCLVPAVVVESVIWVVVLPLNAVKMGMED
jgi:hypothetical protein